MKKYLMVLSFTLAAMVTNAQTKKFVVEKYEDNYKPGTLWVPLGETDIEICSDYVKINNVGNVTKYDIVSMTKRKDGTKVYRVKVKGDGLIEFHVRENEKVIEYIERSSNNINLGTKYYYGKTKEDRKSVV
jgi:hypothetical protein